MCIQRKSVIRWTWITLLCGAHSFFWGVVAKANPVAMLLGLTTLTLMFAVMESHPRYQAKRLTAPRFSRALDCGIRFRLWLAVYVVLSLSLLSVFGGDGSSIFLLPYMGELFIGLAAIELTHLLAGIDLSNMPTVNGMPPLMDNAFATYLTTIFTGLIHAFILAVICVVAYGVIRLRTKPKASATVSEKHQA